MAGLEALVGPGGLLERVGRLDRRTQAALGDSQRDDFVMRYGVGIGHTARVYGRQRVNLEARAEYYDYLHYNVLDNYAYGLTGEWLWEFTNDWSGTRFA